MTDKEKIKCAECESKGVVKKGKRKSKYEIIQKYFCNDCRKYFTLKKLEKKVYPAKVVMDAIFNYNLGNSMRDTAKLVNKKFKVKITKSTVDSWVKEFDEVCSYNRIRDKTKGLFKPKEIIFNKIFRHLQLYKYRYHKAKVRLFINDYFSELRNYLVNISENCPNELFTNSIRSSDIKLGIDISKIKVFKMSINRKAIFEHHQKSLIFEKENYACKIAGLALQSASRNTERHDKLQEFMLINDTCTIATEVPVYLFLDEIKELGVFDLFNSLNENALDEKTTIQNKSIGREWQIALNRFVLPSTHPERIEQESAVLNKPIGAEGGGERSIKYEEQSSSIPPIENKSSVKEFNEFKNNPVITGHIDFVQLKFGSVYVLDYKPDASRADAVSQLFVYALALSVRTGIWLRNFRCAWFDENGYYEFAPSDIVLRFCKVPSFRVREFFVRNKERRYFTSLEFQKSKANSSNLISKRNNNNIFSFSNIGSVFQRSLNMFFGKPRKIIFDDFFLRYISAKQFENLPNHDSCSFESRSSTTDFAVRDDVLVDFNSHGIYDGYSLFKVFADENNLIEEDEEEISNEIKIELKDNSIFTVKDKDKLSALAMKLDVAGITFDEFVQIFIEDVERHWSNRTVPTKFPWDLSWEEDLKDDIWHELYDKLHDWESNEVKKRFGYAVLSLTPPRHFDDRIKEENAKLVREGIALSDKGLILRNDTKEAKDYFEISSRFSELVKKETEKEFAKRKHEAKNRFKNQAELAEVVFYQYIRPYLLGILLSRATKGKSGSIVTSDRTISFVSENKLVSKRLDSGKFEDDRKKGDLE